MDIVFCSNLLDVFPIKKKLIQINQMVYQNSKNVDYKDTEIPLCPVNGATLTNLPSAGP